MREILVGLSSVLFFSSVCISVASAQNVALSPTATSAYPNPYAPAASIATGVDTSSNSSSISAPTSEVLTQDQLAALAAKNYNEVTEQVQNMTNYARSRNIPLNPPASVVVPPNYGH